MNDHILQLQHSANTWNKWIMYRKIYFDSNTYTEWLSTYKLILTKSSYERVPGIGTK
jgi:hypothetical protein